MSPAPAATEATPAAVAADRRRARAAANRRRRLVVLAFLSPWLVGFSIFFAYPLLMSGWLSLHHYDLLTPPRWVGLANYRYLFHDDPEVWPAVKNTLWLIVFAVPITVAFGFGLALALTRARRGTGAFRTVFYLPALVPPVAATLAFVYIFNPATGPVNHILDALGIDPPLWFNDPGWSKPSLVMLGLWGVGTTMIIFLAAVLDVPTHLYESAELDGASAFQRMRWVTLPTISPVILFAVVLGVIGALQYFTQAHVAASVAAGSATQAGTTSTIELGYPEGSTLFYPILVYNQGFRYFNMGYASAMAMLLLVVSFAVTVLIIWNSRRMVHYQGASR